MSRMSDLDIEMQEMLERGSSIEEVVDFFNVPIDWAQEAFANLMQAHKEQINDSWYDEQYELND